jgi:transposase
MKNSLASVCMRIRLRADISIAQIFGGGATFLKKTFKTHRSGESLARRRMRGAVHPLDEEQLAALQAALEICPGATLEELRRLIADECNAPVSRRSIRHALKKLNLPL